MSQTATQCSGCSIQHTWQVNLLEWNFSDRMVALWAAGKVLRMVGCGEKSPAEFWWCSIISNSSSTERHPQREEWLYSACRGSWLMPMDGTLTLGWLDGFVPLESISSDTDVGQFWWDPRRQAAQAHEDGQMSHGSPSFWVTEVMAQNLSIPQRWLCMVKWEA